MDFPRSDTPGGAVSTTKSVHFYDWSVPVGFPTGNLTVTQTMYQ
jgi:hypothetical protein